MRGLWILGVVALGATLVIGARWNGYPTLEVKVDPKAPPLKAGDGFDKAQKSAVEQSHDLIVATLDDLEPTRGRKVRMLLPDGSSKVVEVEARFGMSRMALRRPLTPLHDDPVKPMAAKRHRFEGDQVSSQAVALPHLVVSADGRIMRSDNIGIVWRSEGENLKVDTETVNALRKNVAAANLGEEFAFEVPGHIAWAKPLKLTKKECLSCHPGMKVGDTVAIAAYFAPTK